MVIAWLQRKNYRDLIGLRESMPSESFLSKPLHLTTDLGLLYWNLAELQAHIGVLYGVVFISQQSYYTCLSRPEGDRLN